MPDLGSCKADCSKEKTSTWKMAKSDDTRTFLLLFLWQFIPFARFSSLLHSSTCMIEKVEHWEDQKEGNTGQDPGLLHFLFLSSPLLTSSLCFSPP